MTEDTVIHLFQEALTVSVKVGLPLLLVGLIVGLVVGVAQAVTQIQEMTLVMVPKMIATAVVIVVAGPWMLGQMVTYTRQLYELIPTLVGGGHVNTLLPTIAPAQVAGALLVLARLSPLFVLAPMLSMRVIPVRARLVVAVALAIGIGPLALSGQQVPLDVGELGGLMAKEILVGLAFALVLALVFAAASSAGTFLDATVGFSFGAIIDPLTGNQNAVLTQLYSMVALMIFIVIGGLEWLVQGIAKTYELVPLLDYPALGSLVAGVEQAFAGVFVAALEIAAPVLLAVIITDAAFGIVSRTAPQLNVFAVGFPAKILVGLVMIGVSLPFVATWIGDELQASVRTALQTLRVSG